MSEKRQEALIAWIKLFVPETVEIESFDSLKTCIAFAALLEYLTGNPLVVTESTTSSTEWFLALKKLREIIKIVQAKVKGGGFDRTIETSALARRGDPVQIENMIIMFIGFSLKSPKKQEVVERIKTMPSDQQSVIKSIIKASKTENKTGTETPTSPALNEEMTKRKAEIEGKVASLKEENAKIREDIKNLKKAPQSIPLAKVSEVKARIYTLVAEIEHKKQKLAGLDTARSQLAQLQERMNTVKQEEQQLQKTLLEEESKEPDYSILTDRLEQLKTDPGMMEVSKLSEQKEALEMMIKQWETRKHTLEIKMEGQQGQAKLLEKKEELELLEQKCTRERRLAELNLIKGQKRMRQEAFLLEMQSFV